MNRVTFSQFKDKFPFKTFEAFTIPNVNIVWPMHDNSVTESIHTLTMLRKNNYKNSLLLVLLGEGHKVKFYSATVLINVIFFFI